jgi:stress response protein SCP2
MSDQVISLAKNETINLQKNLGLKKAAIGLGWKAAVRGRNVDLDAAVIALDSSGEGAKGLGFCYFGKLNIFDGCISHSGDDLTGEDNGEGANAPDEIITIALTDLTQSVQRLVVTINSFQGQAFDEVSDAFVTIDDAFSKKRLVEYDLDEQFKGVQTMIVATIDRQPDASWIFKAAGLKSPSIQALLNSYGMKAQ